MVAPVAGAGAAHRPAGRLLLALLLPLLAGTATADKQCVSYETDLAFPGGTPGSVLSTLLVGDEVGPPVGAVEVRDLRIKHPRVGALLVALYWLPYSEAPADLALTAQDLAAAARGRSVLKELHQGAGAQRVDASFADSANATLGASLPSAESLTGDYRPTTPLAVFGSLNLTGRARWVLRVADLGENWQDRQLELESWTLVLCPPENATLPSLLTLNMAQSAALGAGTARGAQRGPASAPRLQALSGGPLLPAVPTLLTVASTTTFNTQSQLADQAVAAVIRSIDNIQSLFNLPYQPQPLIKTFLPWVELLIGGTEFVLRNVVWPGKIVSYALQIEVAVRTRAAMQAAAVPAAPAGGGGNSASGAPTTGTVGAATGTGTGTAGAATGTGTGTAGAATGTGTGASTGSSSSSGSSSGSGAGTGGSGGNGAGDGQPCSDDESVYEKNNPKGIIVGPQGPVTIDKQKMLDQLCMMTGPNAKTLFSRVRDPADPDPADPAAAADEPDLVEMRATSSAAASGGPWGWNGGWQGPQRLGAPLDFANTPQPFGSRGAHAQAVIQQTQATVDRIVPTVGEPYEPSQQALDRILDGLIQGVNVDSISKSMMSGLDRITKQAERASRTLGDVAKSPRLVELGGPDAPKTAEALQAGADTYLGVIKAGQDSLKRLTMPEQLDKTRDWLQNNGGQTAAERAFGQRFVWNLNFVRLGFRFAATDGPVVTFQQFLYQLSDVNDIRSLSKQLAALDDAANGSMDPNSKNKDKSKDKDTGKNEGKDKDKGMNEGKGNQKKGKGNQDKYKAADGAGEVVTATRDEADPAGPEGSPSGAQQSSEGAEDAGAAAAGGAGPEPDEEGEAGEEEDGDAAMIDLVEWDDDIRFDTGETPREFFSRALDDARATAKRALGRVPPGKPEGIDRLMTSSGF